MCAPSWGRRGLRWGARRGGRMSRGQQDREDVRPLFPMRKGWSASPGRAGRGGCCPALCWSVSASSWGGCRGSRLSAMVSTLQGRLTSCYNRLAVSAELGHVSRPQHTPGRPACLSSARGPGSLWPRGSQHPAPRPPGSPRPGAAALSRAASFHPSLYPRAALRPGKLAEGSRVPLKASGSL